MISISSLLTSIDEFCEVRGISPSYFGFLAANDGKLVEQLRLSQNISLRMFNKINAYMADPIQNRHQPKSHKQDMKYSAGATQRPRKYMKITSSLYRVLLVSLCNQIGVDADIVISAPRHGKIKLADGRMIRAGAVRARAAYLMHVELEIPQADLAAALGVTRQAISKSIPLVEDERDDPAVDAALDEIGRLLRPQEAVE